MVVDLPEEVDESPVLQLVERSPLSRARVGRVDVLRRVVDIAVFGGDDGLRSLDQLEKLLLQVTRKNDLRGYERFKDLFEAIVAYNE